MSNHGGAKCIEHSRTLSAGAFAGSDVTAQCVSVRGCVLLVFSRIFYGSFPHSPDVFWDHHPIDGSERSVPKGLISDRVFALVR